MDTSERQVSVGFHVRWVAWFAAVVVGSGLALIWWLRRMLDHALDSGYSQTFYALKNTQKILFPAVGFSVLLYIIFVSFIVLLMAVFASHRIAGPLFRIEKIAASLQRGELQFSCRLRRGDQLVGLTEDLGKIRDTLVAELRPVGPILERIEGDWRALDAASAAEHADEAAAALARIEAELAALRSQLRC